MKLPSYILLFMLSLGLHSCIVTEGQRGNGNVTLENRAVEADFSAIQSSAGLNVYLTQGDENAIVVETDENLQPYIATEIENGVLKIYPEKPIHKSKAKKVHVTFVNIDEITATSASSIRTTSELKSQYLKVNSSSGATADLEVFSQQVTLHSSSGSKVGLSGKTMDFSANASSGAKVKARDLLTVNSTVTATSGSEIRLNAYERLDATASSGARVRYHGNPVVSSKVTSGASISKK